MGAAISSGSFRTDGMIVAPCSAKTLAAIAHGVGDNLIHRAADVILKERRKLVLAVREAPLSDIHLENMLKLSRMGAVVMPPRAGVLHRPQIARRRREPHRGAAARSVRHRRAGRCRAGPARWAPAAKTELRFGSRLRLGSVELRARAFRRARSASSTHLRGVGRLRRGLARAPGARVSAAAVPSPGGLGASFFSRSTSFRRAAAFFSAASAVARVASAPRRQRALGRLERAPARPCAARRRAPSRRLRRVPTASRLLPVGAGRGGRRGRRARARRRRRAAPACRRPGAAPAPDGLEAGRIDVGGQPARAPARPASSPCAASPSSVMVTRRMHVGAGAVARLATGRRRPGATARSSASRCVGEQLAQVGGVAGQLRGLRLTQAGARRRAAGRRPRAFRQ